MCSSRKRLKNPKNLPSAQCTDFSLYGKITLYQPLLLAAHKDPHVCPSQGQLIGRNRTTESVFAWLGRHPAHAHIYTRTREFIHANRAEFLISGRQRFVQSSCRARWRLPRERDAGVTSRALEGTPPSARATEQQHSAAAGSRATGRTWARLKCGWRERETDLERVLSLSPARGRGRWPSIGALLSFALSHPLYTPAESKLSSRARARTNIFERASGPRRWLTASAELLIALCSGGKWPWYRARPTNHSSPPVRCLESAGGMYRSELRNLGT